MLQTTCECEQRSINVFYDDNGHKRWCGRCKGLLIEVQPEQQPERGTREYMEMWSQGRYPSTIAIMRHFAWAHLPADLQLISSQIGETAIKLVQVIPDSPELTAGLRKLLESKDCFVRAAIDAR